MIHILKSSGTTRRATETIKSIEDIIDYKFTDNQSWPDKSVWPLGEQRQINGSLNTKVYESKNQIRFVTEIPPLVWFDLHWHGFSECCHVLGGILADRKSGRTWAVGEIAVFSRGEGHEPGNPSATGSTWLEVIFRR